MDELLQTNIFFYITSAAVVVITILLAAVLVYVLRIVTKVNRLTNTVEKEGKEIMKDVSNLREAVKDNAESVWDRIRLVTGIGHKRTRKQKTAEDKE